MIHPIVDVGTQVDVHGKVFVVSSVEVQAGYEGPQVTWSAITLRAWLNQHQVSGLRKATLLERIRYRIDNRTRGVRRERLRCSDIVARMIREIEQVQVAIPNYEAGEEMAPRQRAALKRLADQHALLTKVKSEINGNA